jgi:hypothetical protein
MRVAPKPVLRRSVHLLAAAGAALTACGEVLIPPDEAPVKAAVAALRVNAPVVISQLHGGGGKTSAPFTDDPSLATLPLIPACKQRE